MNSESGSSAREDSGHFAATMAFSASFPDKTTVPACPDCGSPKFVASLIDMEDSICKGVTCENDHSYYPDELIQLPVADALRAEKDAAGIVNEALDIWLEEYTVEIKEAPDRVAAILAGALFDTLLEMGIRAFTVETGAADSLLEPSSPLGAFGAKIQFCGSFGLISKTEQRALDAVREIRNEFAHKLQNVTFSEQSLGDKARFLGEHLELKGTDPKNPRAIFVASVSNLWGSILTKLGLVNRCAKMPHDPFTGIHLHRIFPNE